MGDLKFFINNNLFVEKMLHWCIMFAQDSIMRNV